MKGSTSKHGKLEKEDATLHVERRKNDKEASTRQSWAFEHYHGKPICLSCKKLGNNKGYGKYCAFAPTTACSFYEPKENEL